MEPLLVSIMAIGSGLDGSVVELALYKPPLPTAGGGAAELAALLAGALPPDDTIPGADCDWVCDVPPDADDVGSVTSGGRRDGSNLSA